MAESLTSFTGISSGLDWRSLVDQMMVIERRPAVKLEAAIAANTKKREAFGGFQTLVQAVKDGADRLAGTSSTGSSPFEAFTTSVTAGTGTGGRNVLAAVALAGAAPGTYAVKVTALASAQKWTGGKSVGPTQLLPAGGTLTIANAADPTKQATIPPIGSDWTLSRLRDEINKLNVGATATGVSASIVNVSATEQRLVLASSATGTANGFTLADDGTSGLLATLGLDGATQTANPSLKVDARNAAFTVDGVAMTRASNSVGDALSGVTLTLAAEGETTVVVERQTSAASDAVKGFVEAYNKVQAALKSQLGTVGSPLYNDSLLRTTRGTLASTMVTSATPASQPGGAAGVADDLTSLAALGVSLQKDGTLAFDQSKLNTLAATRLPDVQALLATRMGALSTVTESLVQPLTGAIDQREANIDTQSARYTSRVTEIDARLEKKRAALIAQFAKFESSLGSLKALGDRMSAQFAGLNARKDD